MKKSKKFLSLILSVVIMLSLAAFQSFAADDINQLATNGGDINIDTDIGELGPGGGTGSSPENEPPEVDTDTDTGTDTSPESPEEFYIMSIFTSILNFFKKIFSFFSFFTVK